AKFFGNFFSKSFQQNEQSSAEGGFCYLFDGGTRGRAPDESSCKVRQSRTCSSDAKPQPNGRRTSRRGAAFAPRVVVVSFGKTFSFR
ncbi:MAG: hypothetical protein K2F84_00805, partial [Bacteroidales bacterium]|nr:hypothetical protein [Bacteroidales bacterium]